MKTDQGVCEMDHPTRGGPTLSHPPTNGGIDGTKLQHIDMFCISCPSPPGDSFPFPKTGRKGCPQPLVFDLLTPLDCNMMSSPLIESNLPGYVLGSLPGPSVSEWCAAQEASKAGAEALLNLGLQASTTCCGENLDDSPNGAVRHPMSQATTCTHHALPTRVSLASRYSCPVRLLFGQQCCV